jgi:hypothetical protein
MTFNDKKGPNFIIQGPLSDEKREYFIIQMTFNDKKRPNFII